MAKRDFRQSAEAAFGDNRGSVTIDKSFTDLDSAIFGNIPAIDAQTKRIKPISIFQITPDPLQPRRVIPSGVRQRWNGSPTMMLDLFDAWYKAVIEERQSPFPLEMYLLSEKHNQDRTPTAGPVETAFLQVIHLAVSIRRDNLTNPITVIPLSSNLLEGNHYQLETGERRWLAFHLLHSFFDGKPGVPNEQARWSKIPAQEVEQINLWRQASENSARADLNAISKARQFALLLMDLWEKHEKTPRTFLPLSAFRTERDYYAQVSGLPVPHGKSEQLLNALGAKTTTVFNRCKDILSLHPEIWTTADDLNLPEDLLLRLAKLKMDEALIKVRQIAQKFPTRKDSDLANMKPDRPTLLTDPTRKEGSRMFLKTNEADLMRKLKELMSLHDGVGQSNDKTKNQIRHMIAEIRQVLDKIDNFIG